MAARDAEYPVPLSAFAKVVVVIDNAGITLTVTFAAEDLVLSAWLVAVITAVVLLVTAGA